MTNDGAVLSFVFLANKYSLCAPKDLHEINISGMDLEDGPTERLEEFSSVTKVDASDNMLTMLGFQHFPQLRELNLSLNQIYRIPEPKSTFLCLQVLDLSFNFLDGHSFLKIGLLPALTRLHMSGNGIQSLPAELADAQLNQTGITVRKFAKLEILHLDDNKLSKAEDIAGLATLPRLRILNLASNRFRAIPLLKSVPNDLSTDEEDGSGKSQSSSLSMSRRSRKSRNDFISPANGTVKADATENPARKADPMQVEGRKMSVSLQLKPFTEEMSLIYPDGPASTERSTFVDDQLERKKQAAETVTEKTQKHHRSEIRRKRRFSNKNTVEYPPRVIIVDEFFGLGKVKTIMDTSEALRQPAFQARPLGSDTVHPVPKSAIRRISGEMNRSKPRRQPAGERLVFKRMTASAALMALKGVTNSVWTTPPFPCLELFDISYNLITYEQHILPVAVWPQLREVSVHHNPVVSRHSGIPPLLEHLLVTRLQLNVRRLAETPSWYNDKGQLIRVDDPKSELNDKQQTQNRNKVLVLPETLLNRSGETLSTRHLLNASQAKIRQSGGKPRRSGPLLVPTRLHPTQLAAPPKPIRCIPDRMLKEYRESVGHSATSAYGSDQSSICSYEMSDRTTSSQEKFVRTEPIKKDEPYLNASGPAIADGTAVIDTGRQKYTTADADAYEDEGSSFFTTQMAQFETNKSWRAEQKLTSDSLCPIPVDDHPIVDQDANLSLPASPGPLLPDLEWLVDEQNLPESMQACLRELRHLTKHRPLIHENSHSASSLPLSNTETLAIRPVGVDLSKQAIGESQDAISDAQKSQSMDLSETETSLKKNTRELALLNAFPKLQYTSMLAIHLPKAMNFRARDDATKCAAKTVETTGNLSTTEEKKPSEKTTKLPRGTAQLAKNLFTQFEKSHEQLLDQIVTKANEHVTGTYDRMADRLHQDIVESLEDARLPISIGEWGESLLRPGIMQ